MLQDTYFEVLLPEPTDFEYFFARTLFFNNITYRFMGINNNTITTFTVTPDEYNSAKERYVGAKGVSYIRYETYVHPAYRGLLQ